MIKFLSIKGVVNLLKSNKLPEKKRKKKKKEKKERKKEGKKTSHTSETHALIQVSRCRVQGRAFYLLLF